MHDDEHTRPAAPGGALPPELDPRPGRHHAPRTHRPPSSRPGRAASRQRYRGLAIGARIVAALLSFTVLLGSGYAWASFHTFTSNVARIDAIGHQSGPNIDGADQNILIVGIDDRSNATAAELKQLSTNYDGGSKNTDTMMLMHVPADGAKATVISFPRDSWVNIPGHGMNKLNAAYALGYNQSHSVAAGAQLLTQTIHTLTGLSIDHYVQVTLLAFYRISLAIGGVDVCLTSAQNAQTDSDSAGSGYSGINLPAGHSIIQGKQALAFVRQRHGLPRGDLDRIVRQQYFLSAAFRKIASAGTLLNPFKLHRLLTAISSSLQVDQSLDLLRLGTQMQNLTAGNVTFTTIPVTGTPTITYNGNQVSIVQIDTAAMPTFIAQVIGQPSAYTKATPADPATVTVDVLNGSGTNGAAATNTDKLKQAGFRTGTPGSTDPTTTTVIEYPAGMEAQAKAVAAHVPGAAAITSRAVHGITLILGTDGKQATGATPDTHQPHRTTPPTTTTQTEHPAARTAADSGCIN